MACQCLALNLFILFGMTFPESRPSPHRYPILKSECREFVYLFVLGLFLISSFSNDYSAWVKTARVFQRFATWTRRHFVGTLTNLAAKGDELLIAGGFARLCVIFYWEYCEILSGTVTRAESAKHGILRIFESPDRRVRALFNDSLLTAERVTSDSIKWY